MKRNLFCSIFTITTLLLASCSNESNDSNDSSNSEETIKGKLKVTEIHRTTTPLGKVKDEYVQQYFYDNGKLVSIKSENTIDSYAVSDGSTYTIDSFFYDGTGKVIKETFSERFAGVFMKDISINEFLYNEKGQINAVKNISTSTGQYNTTYKFYDDLGRLIKITFPDSGDTPRTFSYYGSSFNIKPYFGQIYDNTVNVSRSLCPTKSYADAAPYSANNEVNSVNTYKYDSKNRLIKIIYKVDLYDNIGETIYLYVD